MAEGMDSIGVFIATLHQTIGHRATANFLGMPPGDMTECILCRYDRGLATKADVIERIGSMT